MRDRNAAYEADRAALRSKRGSEMMQKDMDRMDERAVYRNARKELGPEYYAGADPRRRQELEDAGMIHEDHNAIANLPQGVKMAYWPKGGMYLPEELDDRISGIDRQMDRDGSQLKKHFAPKKV